MHHDTVSVHGSSAGADYISQLLVKGVSNADVTDNAALVESKRADALCAVNDLVREDKIHGLDLLLQRAYSREGDDGAHTDAAQSRNIRSVRDFMRSELVVNTVARKESDVDIVVLEDLNR